MRVSSATVIEWVENLSGSFIWPDSEQIKETGEKRRTLRSSKGEVVLSMPIQAYARVRDARLTRHTVVVAVVNIGEFGGAVGCVIYASTLPPVACG
jgi:hypothetical protein